MIKLKGSFVIIREVRYFEPLPLDVDFNFPFTQSDNCEQIVKKVAKVRRDADQYSVRLMNIREMKSAAMLLRRANRIMLCCNSANIPLLQMFQQKMLRVGKIVKTIGHDKQAFMAYALTPKDYVIMVAYSGSSEKRIPTSLLRLMGSVLADPLLLQYTLISFIFYLPFPLSYHLFSYFCSFIFTWYFLELF